MMNTMEEKLNKEQVKLTRESHVITVVGKKLKTDWKQKARHDTKTYGIGNNIARTAAQGITN